MKLHYKGKVVCGDSYRCSSDASDLNGSIWINNHDVIEEIAEEKWNENNVKVICDGEEIANGCCTTSLGWGYSSWTPMDNDECQINDFDLVGFLQSKENSEIELIITDEN